MANEQFSLCWDNFHTNMSSGLSSFLKSEDLVDVTLAVEGRYLKAHKMVLSVCSPYFKELFQVNPCQHPIVFMKDVSYSVMSSLLEFMYQGEVKVSQDVLGTFIKTAEALKIKGLTGDNQVETEPEAESTPLINNIASSDAITLTRKSTRERTPPRKKMLGPASKRFKTNETEFVSTKTDPTTEILPTLNNDHQQTITANDSAPVKPPPLAPLTTFKLEPEETAVSLANEEDISYDDSAMDDLGMDNTADYMMDSNDDAKAGTSSEVANAEGPGENQEPPAQPFTETTESYGAQTEHSATPCVTNNADETIKQSPEEIDKKPCLEQLQIVKLGRKRANSLLIAGYLYKKQTQKDSKAYWRCRQRFPSKDSCCQAKCITGEDGFVTLTGFHNHPPNVEEEKNVQVLYEATFMKE